MRKNDLSNKSFFILNYIINSMVLLVSISVLCRPVSVAGRYARGFIASGRPTVGTRFFEGFLRGNR